MPPAVAAVAVFVAGNVAGGAALTIFGTSILAQAAAGAIIGSAVSAGTAAIMGQDVKKAALHGALAGAVAGGGMAAMKGASWSMGASEVKDAGMTTSMGFAKAGAGATASNMNPAAVGLSKQGILGTPQGGSPLIGNGVGALAPGSPAGSAGQGLSMADAMVQMKGMDAANQMTQLKIGALQKGAEYMLQPDPEEAKKVELDAAIALDESRKIGGLDQVTRNLAQGQVTAPGVDEWQKKLAQLKSGGILSA